MAKDVSALPNQRHFFMTYLLFETEERVIFGLSTVKRGAPLDNRFITKDP